MSVIRSLVANTLIDLRHVNCIVSLPHGVHDAVSYRALAVLHALANVTEGLSLQHLATLLEVPTPSMHRLLALLVADGYVVRSSVNRRYFLGPNSPLLNAGGSRRQSRHCGSRI